MSTKHKAIEYVRSCGEEDGPESYEDAAELFEAVFDRRPDADDGAAGELWSHVCAAVDDDGGENEGLEAEVAEMAVRS